MTKIRPAHALALLFFLQAWFFGWFVTPLGDIPDESGHYAYVVDMTKGRPLPVLGEVDKGRGTISANLWRDWGQPDGSRLNYIVQHPPLYYAVAAIPFSLAKKLTDDRFVWAKVTRLVSAASLGLLIFVCYQILIAVRVEERLALVLSSLFGFVPTVTHLSSGITNDMFLTLMCALATLYLIRFVKDQGIRSAYLCAFWLACAGATKMTAWVLIAGFIGIIIYELRQYWFRWILHAGLITIVAFSSALWWMRRNIYYHGNPFYVSGADVAPKAPDFTLLDYLEKQPFFDWLFQHFYALIGFSGYCNSAPSLEVLNRFCKGVHLTVVHGISMQIFAVICIMLAAVLLAGVLTRVLRRRASTQDTATANTPSSLQAMLANVLASVGAGRWLPTLLILAAVGASVFVYLHGYKLDPRYSTKVYILTVLLLGLTIASLYLVACGEHEDDRLMAYGPVLLSLFTLMLFLKGHEAYVIAERPAGIQGRYLFPFIPLMLASIGLALRPYRWALTATLLVATALAWAHLNAYINTVIPFFNLVRL